ncbi:MAG: hypothetical protein GTO03_09420, partial [Planctomycetales bacterium]|nr:hypothetical protein [Planctomycetales bacterium]
MTVESPNEPPSLAFVGDMVAVTDQTLAFDVRVTDLDEDPLVYSFSGLPAAATLTPSPVYGVARLAWTPTAADLAGSPYDVTLQVQDSGNGDPQEVLEDQIGFRITVRQDNTAPVLLPVRDQMVAEQDTLALSLQAIDLDGDPVTFAAQNLPAGAVLDPRTGLLTWTPSLFDAGIYPGIVLTASDGAASSTEEITVRVDNRNQPPILVPQPPQAGREGATLAFTLAAGDFDGDPLTFTAVAGLPPGAVLDPQTGHFEWTPDFTQAGSYVVRFAVEDSQAESDQIDVQVDIANVNRVPSLEVDNHQVALGQTLTFVLAGEDPDPGSELVYTATGLPAGASLDSETGEFRWTPGPGQSGDQVVTFRVSDGQLEAVRAALIRATLAATAPQVKIVLTPSFPTLPGQPVKITVLADSLAQIATRGVTVDGQPLALDEFGAARFTPEAAGKFVVAATATDADGLIGTASLALKVRDPLDMAPPVVMFSEGLEASPLSQPTLILATIDERNLDSWSLEIAPLGSDRHVQIASGDTAGDAVPL